jgi:hypothetical protein
MADDLSPDVRSELDRLGASFRKAGAADYISVTDRSDGVKLTGPARSIRLAPGLGPEWRALELLRALPDGAGVMAVWRALG